MARCKSIIIIQLGLFQTTLIVFNLILTIQSNLIHITGKPERPRIWLRGYIEEDGMDFVPTSTQFPDVMEDSDFENEFVTRNGSDYYLHPQMRAALFSCQASYPIEWKIPYPEQFSGLTNWQASVNSERSSDFNEGMTLPKNWVYNLHLTMHRWKPGFISCRPVKESTLEKTVYLWWEVEDMMMEGVGETTRVNISSSTTKVIIPCRLLRPEGNISLSKKHQYTKKTYRYHTSEVTTEETEQSVTDWVPVPLSNQVTFDPRVGFTLNKVKASQVIGTYKCTVSKTAEMDVDGSSPDRDTDTDTNTAALEEKIVEVALGIQLSYDFKPRSSLTSPKAQVTTTLSVNSTPLSPVSINCCSGDPSQPAVGDAYFCENGAECEFLKEVFVRDNLLDAKRKMTSNRREPKDCFTTRFTPHHQGKLLMCRGPHMDVAAEYITSFKDEETPEENESDHSRLFPHFDDLAIYDTSKNLSIGRKIHFTFQTPQDQHYYFRASELHSFFNFNFGRARYPEFHVTSAKHIEKLRLKEHFDKLGVQLHSRTYNRTIYTPLTRTMFEGEPIVVVCRAHQFFYAEGGWLQLNWRNGGRTVLRESNLLYWEEDGDFIFMRSLIASDHTILGRINNLTLDMKSIDCLVPLWNKPGWENRTHELDIRPSFLPSFVNPANESITLSLNDTDVVLNCSLVATEQSLLLPEQIRWEKDGKIFGEEENNIGSVVVDYDQNRTTSSLTFYPVTHETQGEYKCTGANFRGEVMKTFTIYVEGAGNSSHLIKLGIITSLTLLSGVIGLLMWKHWRLRLQISRGEVSLR